MSLESKISKNLVLSAIVTLFSEEGHSISDKKPEFVFTRPADIFLKTVFGREFLNDLEYLVDTFTPENSAEEKIAPHYDNHLSTYFEQDVSSYLEKLIIKGDLFATTITVPKAFSGLPSSVFVDDVLANFREFYRVEKSFKNKGLDDLDKIDAYLTILNKVVDENGGYQQTKKKIFSAHEALNYRYDNEKVDEVLLNDFIIDLCDMNSEIIKPVVVIKRLFDTFDKDYDCDRGNPVYENSKGEFVLEKIYSQIERALIVATNHYHEEVKGIDHEPSNAILFSLTKRAEQRRYAVRSEN